MSHGSSAKFNKPIGLLGGTFDPIHNGHLYIASCVLNQLHFDRILFIPSYQPVHRLMPKANSDDRRNMVQLAIGDHANYVLDERELTRHEPSYMIVTARSLRLEFPNTPLCLVLGSDAFAKITTWYCWQELFDYVHFIIINRTDFALEMPPDPFLQGRQVTKAKDLCTHLSGKVYFLSVTPCDISATEIRALVKEGKPIMNLVPPGVAEYIYRHGLYG